MIVPQANFPIAIAAVRMELFGWTDLCVTAIHGSKPSPNGTKSAVTKRECSKWFHNRMSYEDISARSFQKNYGSGEIEVVSKNNFIDFAR
jgi:hypothetical protein